MSSNELDSQLRAVGVNKEQRKRLIAASRLGGIPNPLKQLGLREPEGGRSRSRSPRRAVAWQAALEAPPPPAATGALPLAITAAPGPSAVQRLARAPARPAPRGQAKEEDDPDLDSFLAGGRAIMAKAKAMGQARREQAQAAREQVETEQQQNQDQEAAAEEERARLEEERRREAEERERREEEERREARRRARKEEKMRRKEQKKRQRAEEEEVQEDDEESAEEVPEDDEAERRRRQQAPSKGFFSQAFKGNQQQRALWSEPIKGHVSNNYKGTSDADLERRFRLIGAGAQSVGEKLMTEEEVLAMLKNRKSKGGR